MSDEACAVLDHVPDGFLDCPAARLFEALPGPTLFELHGRDPRPLFVSTLLHGNEDSGLAAVQEVLRRHAARGLPRSLLLFIGNVEAAAQNLRMTPEQPDFNRIWPGTEKAPSPHTSMARWVYDQVARQNVFASVDIHNNTGFNPHYSCIARLEPQSIALALLFSRLVVHSQRPVGTLTNAFAALCPAITVECGRAGGETGKSGAKHAAELLEAALSIAHLPELAPAAQDVELLRSFAIVKTPPGASFSFDGSEADFKFRAELDRLNFSELEAGESFGRLGPRGARLEIFPGDGGHAPEDYFDYAGGDIRLRRAAIPAMLTQDPRAIRSDCLCYLMHRIDMEGRRL
ncbi:MAG TPA: M14 family metallopeptidase [Methylocystis sp.]|nr:M14 family metallopeptidase [Methylocystis sp.]